MTIHSFRAANQCAMAHSDADAVRMMLLGLPQDEAERFGRNSGFGRARVVVSAGFPVRKTLTMGHAEPRN